MVTAITNRKLYTNYYPCGDADGMVCKFRGYEILVTGENLPTKLGSILCREEFDIRTCVHSHANVLATDSTADSLFWRARKQNLFVNEPCLATDFRRRRKNLVRVSVTLRNLFARIPSWMECLATVKKQETIPKRETIPSSSASRHGESISPIFFMVLPLRSRIAPVHFLAFANHV